MSFGGSTKSFFQGYMLEVASVVTVVTTMGIAARMGTSWLQFPFLPYSGMAMAAALLAYLTAFTGMWAYLTTCTWTTNLSLEESGNLETFTSLLSEPCTWGNRTLVLTLAYFASDYWPANATVSAGLQFASLAAIVTTFISIIRNFHILKLYLKYSMEHTEDGRLTDEIINRLRELEETQSDETPE